MSAIQVKPQLLLLEANSNYVIVGTLIKLKLIQQQADYIKYSRGTALPCPYDNLNLLTRCTFCASAMRDARLESMGAIMPRTSLLEPDV